MISSNALNEIVIGAGKEILKVYNSPDFDIEIKEDKSPLTKADKLANNFICKKLQELYPKIPILSEENDQLDYEQRKEWDACFIVDPLDGTKEFIKKNGEFTVNIAFAKYGRVVDGFVYAPVLNTLYYTEDGKSYKSVNGNEPTQLPLKEKQDNFKVVTSRSHLSGETLEFVETLKSKHSNLEMVSAGSSLKFCLVAEGSADIYPRLGPTMEWDTAAAHAVVENAGAKVLIHETNESLSYNKEDLLNPYFIVSR